MSAEETDIDEPTAVVHLAWSALVVIDAAGEHTGADARELREDAQRIAAVVPWSWATTLAP